LEKFSLILFGFDESELGAKNERTLGFVAESFTKKNPQKLSIVGYTDELGEETHNDELSHRRASEASKELERALESRGLKLPDNTLIDGKGSREKLYDNALPEGRFFSRTVNITVEHSR
jgi:outer membrane protein OmpA-like peptidoglycan-associated protein